MYKIGSNYGRFPLERDRSARNSTSLHQYILTSKVVVHEALQPLVPASPRSNLLAENPVCMLVRLSTKNTPVGVALTTKAKSRDRLSETVLLECRIPATHQPSLTMS